MAGLEHWLFFLSPGFTQGLGKTQTLPCHGFCAPHTGYQDVSGDSSKSNGAESLDINPLLLSLPPPSLGPTSDPGSPDTAASVLPGGGVELEVAWLGAELLGEMRAVSCRAGSCGAPLLLDDILTDTLPVSCCPSTFFLEEKEYLQ